MQDKLERDGKVAVVYSPGYGAGWSTWSDEVDPTDKDIAEAIDKVVTKEELISLAKKKYPTAYTGGLEYDGVSIAWVPKGTRYYIEEYDGSEQVHILDENFGRIA